MFDAPPIEQYAPILALPAIPVLPAITVWAPTCTLWAICTKLSIFTPSPITVSSSAPRSMQVLAPISTSLPIRTAPSWAILSHCPCCCANPKPSAPITTPECRRQRAPIRQSYPTETRELSTVPAPTTAPRSTTHKGPRLGSLRLPHLCQARKVSIRIFGDDTGSACQRCGAHGGRHNDTARLRSGQLSGIAQIA